jgi:drug/metabolite transporter (DMT)-like permease
VTIDSVPLSGGAQRRLRGYAEIGGTSLIMGTSGALLLVGERPPLSTWLEGALIIAAGILAIALGAAETEVPA